MESVLLENVASPLGERAAVELSVLASKSETVPEGRPEVVEATWAVKLLARLIVDAAFETVTAAVVWVRA